MAGTKRKKYPEGRGETDAAFVLRQMRFASVEGRRNLIDKIAAQYGAGFARSVAAAADKANEVAAAEDAAALK